MVTSFSYNNLRVGDKFKVVGGDDTIYVRARGGFYRVSKDGQGTVGAIWRQDHPNSPVTSGLQAVEPVFGDDWNKVIEGIGERRKTEHEALQAKLGEPAVFVPDPDDSRFGIGYWKGDGGVFAYRKYVNGYEPHSRMEYPNSLIDLLNKVRGTA